MPVRIRLPLPVLAQIMDNLSGAYDLTERVIELEQKFQQLEKDINVLFEIVNKIRPKYYKLQNELPAKPSATPGSTGP